MDKNKQKNISVATLVFGYLDLLLCVLAVIFATESFIRKSRSNASGGEVVGFILILLYAAVLGIIFLIITTIVYSALLGVKIKHIDHLHPKRTKALDIATIVIALVGSIAGSAVLIYATKNDSNDITYISLMVIIDIVFAIILASVVVNTIDYVKAKKTVFADTPTKPSSKTKTVTK